MFGDCFESTQDREMAEDSNIFSMEDLERDPETVMELEECLTCSDHNGKNIKYYCKDHMVSCCDACIIEVHKTCSHVKDLKEELPVLLSNLKPDEIFRDLKKIEIHLVKFMEMNEPCVDNPGNQIKKSTDQIREVRKKINVILDEIEKQVKAEGSKLYKDMAIYKQNENHHCLMLSHAVRYAQYLLGAVHTHGSNLQKGLIAEKVRFLLEFYTSEVDSKFQDAETGKVKVEYSNIIETILSESVSELVKIESIAVSNILPITGSLRQIQNCQLDLVDVAELKSYTGDAPRYTGITFLPGDRLMIVDHDNNQCILLNSSYQFITSYTLTGDPWNVCVLDDQEVAVSLIHQNSIQILSVVDDVIRPVRMMPTKYNCKGIAAAGKGKMVVNWYCGNCKSELSLINTRGDVKFSLRYQCSFRPYSVCNFCVALNNANSRVYISVDLMDSFFCFDMGGNNVFTYKAANLTCPRGVDVDRYDNIYVIGQSSNNIHQLSPDGAVLQVITSGVPTCPYAVCINKTKDILVVTNFADKTKLYIYQLT